MSEHTILVSLLCPDRTGLVAAVAGALFDLGADIGDSTFAVLGEGAELSAVCTIPGEVSVGDVKGALAALPAVEGGQLTVQPFDLKAIHGPRAHITHRIVITGGDRPGLVARLAETLVQYEANIVRLNTERIPTPSGPQYYIRLAVSIPPANADRCLATVANTAGELGLTCHWEQAEEVRER